MFFLWSGLWFTFIDFLNREAFDNTHLDIGGQYERQTNFCENHCGLFKLLLIINYYFY